MEKKMILDTLLRKLNKIDRQIKKLVNEPCTWRIANYDKKYGKLIDEVYKLKDEFAAIGYNLNALTREVTELA